MLTQSETCNKPRIVVPELIRENEARFAGPPRGILRRSAKYLMFKAIENGWFGLCPLDTHIVICGFVRSGSTLLLLITDTCVADTKIYNSELPADGVALNPLRIGKHPRVVTKFPADIFHTDEIREMYASRRANVRFVLTKRDPRAVLVSRSKHLSDDYYLTPELWKHYYDAFCYAQDFEDTTVVRYEELVQNPSAIEKQMTDFIGWKVRIPFADFYSHVAPDIPQVSMVNLNGLRPLDKLSITGWQKPEHRERIRSLLRTMPELPEYLIEMGYETDTSWADPYVERAGDQK